MNGLLCIGGPYAGRRVRTRNGHPRFVASEPDGLTPLSNGEVPPSEARWRQVIYVLQDWSTSDGRTIQFFTPANQTADQTMQLLIEAYERLLAVPPEWIKP